MAPKKKLTTLKSKKVSSSKAAQVKGGKIKLKGVKDTQ